MNDGGKSGKTSRKRISRKEGVAGRSGYGNHAVRSVRSLIVVVADFSVSLGITARGSKALGALLNVSFVLKVLKVLLVSQSFCFFGKPI